MVTSGVGAALCRMLDQGRRGASSGAGTGVPVDPGRPPGTTSRGTAAKRRRPAQNDAMQQRRATRAGIAVSVVSALLAVAGFWLAWGPGQRSLAGLVHDNTLNNAGNGVWI